MHFKAKNKHFCVALSKFRKKVANWFYNIMKIFNIVVFGIFDTIFSCSILMVKLEQRCFVFNGSANTSATTTHTRGAKWCRPA